MTQKRKGKKASFYNKYEASREAEQFKGFLHSIGFKYKTDNLSYGSLSDVLKAIFEASGQLHLVNLVKLRKYWNTEIGEFLAKHAMPSRITLEKNFHLDKEYVAKLILKNLDDKLIETVQTMIGRNYRDWQGLNSALTRRLGRKLTQMERKILYGNTPFVLLHTVLHLTVYDGSIAQAIKFEEATYLERFQSICPELKLGAIRCKVGALGNFDKDQMQFENLSSVWIKLIPKSIFSLCSPDRIYRVNEGHAVLIVGCKSAATMKRLRHNPGGSWMLQRIRESFPDLDDSIKKLALIYTSNRKAKVSVFDAGKRLLPPSRDSEEFEPKSVSKNDAKISNQKRLKDIIGQLRSINNRAEESKPKTKHF